MSRIRWRALLGAVLLTGGGPAVGGEDLSPTARIAAGQEVYERCAACHSLERDRTGPRHCGLLGRRAGGVRGFPYSDAMRESGIVWTRRMLDRFIEDPLDTVPGTFMGYAGVPDDEERAWLLDFLEAAASSARCRELEEDS